MNLLKTGCQWRVIPKDFAPKSSSDWMSARQY